MKNKPEKNVQLGELCQHFFCFFFFFKMLLPELLTKVKWILVCQLNSCVYYVGI